MQEYTYEQTGTSVIHYEEGKVIVNLSSDNEVIKNDVLEIEWLIDRLTAISKMTGKPVRILVDLGKIEHIVTTDPVKHKFIELVSSPICAQAAFVGDDIIFAEMLSILLLLPKPRQKVKYFHSINDAKDWLTW